MKGIGIVSVIYDMLFTKVKEIVKEVKWYMWYSKYRFILESDMVWCSMIKKDMVLYI